jgi:PAX-interacting protein 1
LPVHTNKFAPLSKDHSEAEGEKTQQRPRKAPPIFVSGVQNIQPLKELLVTVTENDFELKILNGDQVKIQPSFTDRYHTIVKALAEKHTEFHAYQPKENRSFRTVLRGIHYSTDTNEIKTEIEKLGHKVVNIFNIKQTRTNIPLPLFFVDLKPSDNSKEIYRIETLNYSKVKFELSRSKRNIPQCSKCQRYGHTQTYCYHSTRCLKCTGNHPTKQCLRTEKSDAVKCVLCEGNHPANYKGCAIYKELQKKTFASLRDKRVENPQPVLSQSYVKPTISYASTLKSQQPQHKLDTPKLPHQTPFHQKTQMPPSNIQELKEMMKGLMEQLGILLSLLTTLVSKMA